jgi:ferredoxin/flavodoxin---NADP+ reductase
MLLERRPVSGTLLRLMLSRPTGFTYRAGQHVKMGVRGLLRTYSFVSAPHEPDLEFFVELLPSGRLSEKLRGLRPGAHMALGKPSGSLALEEQRPIQLMIATATGIAPFVSLLRHHLHDAKAGTAPRFVILHGASRQTELGYRAELATLAQRHPSRVAYIPTISRPDDPANRGWDGERGRVESVAEVVVAKFRLTPADTAVLACGNPAMVTGVARRFRRGGFATHTEPFD